MNFDLHSEAKKLSPEAKRHIDILINRQSVRNESFKCQGMHVIDDWFFGTVWLCKRNKEGKLYVDPMNTEQVAQYQIDGFFQYQVKGGSIQ